MLRVEVRYFRPELIHLGDVELGAYRLVKEESIELQYVSESDAVDKVYDLLVSVVERYRSEQTPLLVEVRARLKQGEIAAATLTRSFQQSRLVNIYPRPVRLNRVGVKRKSNSKMEWYSVSESLYVFQGKLNVPEDVEYLVFDTEEGFRVVTANEVKEFIEEQRREKREKTSARRRRKRG